MTSTLRTPDLPSTDLDPFDHDSLEDPAPLHTELRDAGPVVYLNRYDVYAMARYEQVHAALTDGQGSRPAAGGGLSTSRYEKPGPPPSLLLEADPPHHDAPRTVLTKVLGPRALRKLRQTWIADAHDLVKQGLTQQEV